MKLDYQTQSINKISNQYDLFKQTISGRLSSKLFGIEHLNIKSLQVLYNNDSIIVYQENKRFLSQEDQNNLLLIYQNNNFQIEENLNKIDDQQPHRMSQTDSLSFTQDQLENNNILDSDNLVKLYQEQENVFTNINSIDFIITSYKKQSCQLENFSILFNKGNYSSIYQGYCCKTQENISVKIENYSWNQFIENRFQYQIQYEIYNLYPKLFLRIYLPVFISINQCESVQVISKQELGEMNLFSYSQQSKITDKELMLIKKQLLNQIQLLHKHNIAHRDIKPQNIVFVKGKGWILCDFELSMKYISEICVASIKGTKCFLPYNLQYNSCQAGVNLNIEREDYLYFNFLIHEEMETYLPCFKNLIRLDVLKSVKFWRQLFKICKIKDCSILIRFMHNLGLSDIILQFGKNILNQSYQITIHSYLIKQLFVLDEHDQMYQEYQDMIRLKDFQNITSEEQKQIAELQLLLFSDQIEEKDQKYLQQHYIDEHKSKQVEDLVCGIVDRINNCNNTDEKLNALINNFTQSQKDVGVDYIKVIYVLELYKIAFNQIDINDLFKFDILMKDKIKYFCQAPFYIQLLRQSIFFEYLYGCSKQIQGYKNINMLLMYYQESQQQQTVLNIIKQCSLLIYSIKKVKKYHQIIQKVSRLCKEYEYIQYNLYKILFLNSIIQILQNQKYQDTFQLWYRILLWLQYKFQDLISLKFGQAELGCQFQILTMNWMKIRGRKRHDKLVNDLTIKNSRMKQFYEMNYFEKMSIQFLSQIRLYESVTQIFLRNQNLYR